MILDLFSFIDPKSALFFASLICFGFVGFMFFLAHVVLKP